MKKNKQPTFLEMATSLAQSVLVLAKDIEQLKENINILAKVAHTHPDRPIIGTQDE